MSKFATLTRTPRRTTRRPVYTPTVTSSVPVRRAALTRPTVTNLAGGKAFRPSDKMEFYTGITASLLGKHEGRRRHMYEDEAARLTRLAGLIPSVGAEFAAKCVLDTRIKHGLRSISHAMVPHIIKEASGAEWLKDFIAQVWVRPDDGCEIAGYAMSKGLWATRTPERRMSRAAKTTGPKYKIPAAFKKGGAKAIEKFDYYRLAKYAGGQRKPSLADIVNICHPKETAKNAKALKDLAKGTIKQQDTWETMLSQAGQTGKSKAEVWGTLISEGKLGHMALLRNLRNIATECNQRTLQMALDQLKDPVKLKKSGILPFQFMTAYTTLKGSGVPHTPLILECIDEAMEISAGNVPSVGDDVLIAIDESGSMGPLERDNAAMFAAILMKANPRCDVMFFANRARMVTFNRRKSIMELIEDVRNSFTDGGTNFNVIFNDAPERYDSVIILSDQEGWMEGGAPTSAMENYKAKYGDLPVIFTFDLGGDGALMFREDGIIALSGFSFEVFKLLSILKRDRVKLIDEIDKIQIGKPLPSRDDEED